MADRGCGSSVANHQSPIANPRSPMKMENANNASLAQSSMNLKQLFQLDAGVILLQDLIVRRAIQRHAERADLAHSNAMPPTLPVKRHADQLASRVAFFVEIHQAIAQPQQRPEAQG